MPAKVLFRCPYGHDSDFTRTESFVGPHVTRTRIDCLTCGRSFLHEHRSIEISSVLFGGSGFSEIIGYDRLDDYREVSTPAGEVNNPRYIHAYKVNAVEIVETRITWWSGAEFQFVVEDELFTKIDNRRGLE